MDILFWIVPILFVVLVYVVFVLSSKWQKLISSLELLKKENEDFLNTKNIQNEKLTRLNDELSFYKSEIKGLEIENASITQRLELMIKDRQSQKQEFEILSSSLLRIQTSSIEQQQRKGLKELLDPLKEKIDQFERRVESSNIESVKRHESLKEQIRHLSDQSDRVSRDANNLARALKGDYKKQGNWGELILVSVLEKSGLGKDREFFVQSTGRDESNRSLRPDVVIHIPGNKRLVIDSKVSLVAYDALMASEDESQLKAHAIAVKKHIDTLSIKNYQSLYNMQSPDFVLMFIPIDTAFSMALQSEPTLFQYAFDKNVVIVTPTTLLATLKTVDSMWRNDRQQKYAVEIAQEAGKMYDKFVLFLNDMELLGRQIETSKTTFDQAVNKLSIGRGNLIKRAQKLKLLGAKTTKALKDRWVEEE